jgi:hypothetical protein
MWGALPNGRKGVVRSIKLLLAFASTIVPSFSLLEIHDQDFCSLLIHVSVSKRGPPLRRGRNLGFIPSFGSVITFASFQELGISDSHMQLIIKCVNWTGDLLGRCLRHSFGMPLIPHVFFNFKEFINFCKSHGRILSRGVVVYSFQQSLHSSTWTIASTCRSWFSSHKSWGVNCFYEQSAIALALSRNFRPKGPRIAVGAHDQSLIKRNFAMGHILWGVTSQLPILVSHRSSASFRVIRLICLVTKLTAVLHAGYLVSYHIFRASVYILTIDLGQEDRCLYLKV